MAPVERQKKGCYLLLGGDGNKLLVCEGFATRVNLNESTLCAVFIAIDAENLKPVAEIIRQRHPGVEIIICGYNDESGLGQLKAREAALICGGKYMIPENPGMDWNDVLAMEMCNG